MPSNVCISFSSPYHLSNLMYWSPVLYVAYLRLITKSSHTVGTVWEGDYHGQMIATYFEYRGAKKLTSNLPPQPVIVLDNSPYHCLQIDRPLSTCIVKRGMIWLSRKGIVSDETMSKYDFPVTSSTEGQRDINEIDCTLANNGHEVRLPPYL